MYGRLSMRNDWTFFVVTLVVTLAFSPQLHAQKTPPTRKLEVTTPVSPRDLSGLWTIRRGMNGGTWGKVGPEMTPWAEAKFKTAKPGSMGDYPLAQTNDKKHTKKTSTFVSL